MLEVDKVLSQSCEQSHKNRMLVELSEMESKDGLKISKKHGNVSKCAVKKKEQLHYNHNHGITSVIKIWLYLW